MLKSAIIHGLLAFLFAANKFNIAPILADNYCLFDANDTLIDDEEGSVIYLPDYGCLRGVINDTRGLRSFTSIPYATPPTAENNLRFTNPTKHAPWNNTRNATTIAPACMQDCDESSVSCYKKYSTMSEDCLYLNVWTPWPLNYTQEDGAYEEGYPVMLFIHGGSYLDGWSGSILYNGMNIAVLNDVITISINYRMGAFGYLYHKDYGFDGNYGYYDQLFAIEWVYNNIEYFGGNKNNITLFGESAGAMSVGTILMNYNDSSQTNVSSMYVGAIMESNPLGLPFRTKHKWEELAEAFMIEAGCALDSDPESCLRSSSTSSNKLLTAQGDAKDYGECSITSCSFLEFFAPWTPTFETDILPQSQPLWGFKYGEYSQDKPILIGTNRNEAILFIYSFLSSSIDCLEYDIALALLFDDWGKTDKIIEKYKDDAPSDCNDDHREVAAKIFTDFLFKCPTRYSMKYASGYNNDGNNVYMYNYNYYYTRSKLWFETVSECHNGNFICHGAELPEVFYPTKEGFNYTARDYYVSDMMRAYWSQLAKHGEPGSFDGVEWIPFVNETQWSMVFNKSGFGVMEQFTYDDDDYCKFWDDLDYFWMKGDSDDASNVFIGGNWCYYCCLVSIMFVNIVLQLFG